jgi:predicted phosphoribosyltransferase
MTRFADRTEAGRALAAALVSREPGESPVVLALPRGGVPVAFEVAKALSAPLDVLVVRKIGAPDQPELAIGAVATGGVIIRNEEILAALGIDAQTMARATAAAQAELVAKEQRYRTGREPLAVEGRAVILVDDGAATGATMRAAVVAARQRGARKVIVALPNAATDAAATLAREADELVCLHTPEHYFAVGYWYLDFAQVSDAEVARLLSEAGRPMKPA